LAVWTPKFQAVQEEGLVKNVLRIIERDFKQALDCFYLDTPSYLTRYGVANEVGTTGVDLDDFRERELGQIVGNGFPSLAIGPNRGTSGDGPNDECLRQNVLIDIHIGVVNDSPATVTETIMRYRTTMDMTLRSAPLADYFRDMSVEVFGFVLDEIDYEYGPIRGQRPANFRAALLQVPIKINER
jgi:hypothetical protein